MSALRPFVWLDLGFTLVRFAPDQNGKLLHPTDRLMQRLGCTSESDRIFIDWAIFANTFVVSSADLAETLETRFKKVGALEDLCKEFWEQQQTSPRAYPDALPLLKFLNDQKISYGLISNCTLPMWEGVRKLFGEPIAVPRLLSCGRGKVKPHLDLFKCAEEFTEVWKCQPVMVGDDIINDIQPALVRGWKTIFLQEQAEERVRAIGGAVVPPGFDLNMCTVVGRGLADVPRILNAIWCGQAPARSAALP